MLLDDAGQPRELTVLQVLNHFGYRGIQTQPGEFNLKLLRAERLSRERGKVVLVAGPVVTIANRWLPGPESRALGTPEMPRKCVIEAELEVAQEQRNYYAPYGGTQDGMSRLPFVRVFSLDTKGYVYVDGDDVAAYEFDVHAMSKLHLPSEMLGILSRVINTSVEGLFGDVIKGKHGGVVILAAGNPDVGKTLTAEVYAEQTQRPLYVLELGELGTNVQPLEDNLNRVFDRVARWNAVLQFDECEIFLAQRGEDLERRYRRQLPAVARLLPGHSIPDDESSRGSRSRGPQPGDAASQLPGRGPGGPHRDLDDDARIGRSEDDGREHRRTGGRGAQWPPDPQPDAPGPHPSPRRHGHARPDAECAAVRMCLTLSERDCQGAVL